MLDSIISAIVDAIVQAVSIAPQVNNNNAEIIFVFNKGLKILMLVCTILFGLFLIFGVVLLIVEPNIGLFAIIYFGVFGIFLGISIYGYLIQKNKKIILKNNIFYITNFLGKVRKFRFDDIVKVKFIYGDGIVLYTRDNDKFKIDEQMSNYQLIVKKILARDINIINWRGNIKNIK